MKNVIWWFCFIISTATGIFSSWQLQTLMLSLLIISYIGCFKLKLPSYQLAIETLYGGLVTGLGLQFLIAYGIKGHIIAMVIFPLIIWLVLRLIFMGFETKYTLTPKPAIAQLQAEDSALNVVDNADETWQQPTREGVSAWAGDSNGSAAQPDANGQYMRYEYFVRGEICMGGPSDGDAIFSNKCAFSGVGPSIALSEDGRYAAMVTPSRSEWGLLIADLHEKRTYSPNNIGFWEFDRIEKGIIYGRNSPITHNSPLKLSIEKAIASATELPMVLDDGWWVIDHEWRKPLKQYPAVSITSNQCTHKITFVPDLTPFKSNPFLRDSNPNYSVLVDDELVDFDRAINRTEALWVDGLAHEKSQDGRFLVLPRQIIDFKDAASGEFSIKNYTILPFYKGCDEHTHVDFEYGKKSDAGNGQLLAQGYVLPRSTGFEGAEDTVNSCTSPWDEEEISYWDMNAKKRLQARSRIQRLIAYQIDLAKFSQTKQINQCVEINLVNRGNPKHQASLRFLNESSVEGGYSAYRLNTSCGITLENVLHEAIWSHCGRFLAVVHFECPPLVPHKISMIDFKKSCIKEITGSYALPSFIWFDADMLDFTHLIGINEQLNFGPDRNDDENQQLRLSDPTYAANPYAFLIKGIDQRRAKAEKRVELKKSIIGYSGVTISQVSQHSILFAPNFDAPVLQPPIGVKD
jgi:hypothetical protein